MRIFLAGATGVIGRPLVPALIAGGHHVIGMTRSREKVDALRAVGAEPVVADALDAEAVMDAVGRARTPSSISSPRFRRGLIRAGSSGTSRSPTACAPRAPGT